MKKNIAAFFDIDGTLHRDSLMMEHFKRLIRYEIIDPHYWYSHAQKAFRNWDKRMGNYEDYLLEVAEIYLKSMKGQNKHYIDFIVEQVIDTKGDRVYRFTRDRIYWHKQQGHHVFFISGSPDYLVEKMAEKYRVEAYRATQYLVDDENNFTGEIVQMWDSESKKKAMADIIQKYQIDLAESYAYGDTKGDLSMLQAVGNPVAINPAKELLTEIKRNDLLRSKTMIIVERKDVIYKLDPCVEML
ncbi:HAD-superfamily subfamily IB hydrolase, TIGR01490 [Tindallia magadiensis]|uniref:phosphoserine phosphatase n=1 Tax=Tindallia magadiensis TaxID=69895 RepID=A0A1I3AUS1_9FIRM|nr:HAD-IB family hydrolase [Tindallia magadiensis]SFH53700.1 HAD-superfamily subfamily IB hydrolase, TIGR01490 [Tindallia magadiensis]